MKEITVKIIKKLLDKAIDVKDISKIMSNELISEALENGADFEITNSVEEFGENNSDNDLYEEDEEFESWGEFLLSTPGAWENIKLPSGKVFSLIK